MDGLFWYLSDLAVHVAFLSSTPPFASLIKYKLAIHSVR